MGMNALVKGKGSCARRRKNTHDRRRTCAYSDHMMLDNVANPALWLSTMRSSSTLSLSTDDPSSVQMVGRPGMRTRLGSRFTKKVSGYRASLFWTEMLYS
jgi:hypothetical protein